MKKQVLQITTVAGLLLFGSLSAFAADSYYKRADKQTVQQFTQETSALTSALKAKEAELRELSIYTMNDSHIAPGPDYGRISALEAEIKELKNKIDSVALKYELVAQP
jgi:hypothetical protein